MTCGTRSHVQLTRRTDILDPDYLYSTRRSILLNANARAASLVAKQRATRLASPLPRHRHVRHGTAQTASSIEKHGVRGELAGGAGLAEQGRQRVAADGGYVRGHPVHAGPGGALRQHRQEEVGRQLRLHGALRLRILAPGVGAGGVPHGLRRAAAALLGQGGRGADAGLPRRPRQAVGDGAGGHAARGALLPGGDAGDVPVRVRRHHAHPARRLLAGPHEHQGLDGLHAALAHALLHRRRLQPLGRRLPLPLGRHRLLRRLRHPPLLRHRRVHRRLLGGPEAEERPGAVLPEQHPAHDRRRRAAVDGVGRVQRRRAVRRQHHGVGGRAQHQRQRGDEPPHVDLPRRHLLRQAVRHRRRPGHDDRPRLHHPRRRVGADVGGRDHRHLRRQRAVVHHDDPAQEVGATDEGGRHPGRLPHPRRGRPPRRHPHGAPGHAGAHDDGVLGAGAQGRVLRRRHQAGGQAAGRRGVRDRVEHRGHHAHPARHRAVRAAADARRPAHDRRRRRARGGGLRAVGRRREVRRHAARRVQGRRRGEGDGHRGAAARRHGSQGRHHPVVGGYPSRVCTVNVSRRKDCRNRDVFNCRV